VRANGMDSQDDLMRLQAIFEAVQTGEAFFYNNLHLIVVVTRCDEPDEHNAITDRMTERLQNLAQKIGIEDELYLTVLCVDFGKEQEALNHEDFAKRFWQAIFAPIAQEKTAATPSDWASRLQHWPADWMIQTKLSASLQLIKTAKQFMEQFKKQDQFVANMNNTRLLGLSEKERREKIHSAWLKQVGAWSSSTDSLQKLQVTDDHPLALWWSSYWLTQLYSLTNSVDKVVSQINTAIQQLPNDVPDLQRYFDDRVETSYQQAIDAFQSHFYCVCDALEPIQHDNNQAKIVATLLSLSIIDVKYADYYQLLKTA